MMKYTWVIVLLPVLGLAHHGWQEFDEKKEITLSGIVTDFHFVNPHCVIEFDVTDEKGAAQTWQAEFASPAPMAKKGWTASTVGAGDKISISGHPGKKGLKAVHATKIRLASGQEFTVEAGR